MRIVDAMTRRMWLRGAGAAVALPFLESAVRANGRSSPPKRLVFVGFPWGVTEDSWFCDPSKTGPGTPLSPGLAPLERHRKDLAVLSHLSILHPGNGHWGMTTWLTCVDVQGTPGKQFQNGISADQVAARRLGEDVRFASLELTGRSEGGWGPGQSLAWTADGSPIAGESDPTALFDRLFGAEEVPLAERRRRIRRDESLLDAVNADAKALKPTLGREDAAKLEAYVTSIRDIERRLSKSEQWLEAPKPKALFARPKAKLKGSEEIRTMYDLMAAALQTDLTRVITYRQPAQELLHEEGFRMDAHATTHYSKGSDKHKASQAKDRKLAEHFAHFLDRLKASKEADGKSLLDHTIVVFGGGIRTGHRTRNLPVLVAGHGGGGVRQGRHLAYESEKTPLANLWLGLLRHVGCPVDRFGDSTGPLDGLFG